MLNRKTKMLAVKVNIELRAGSGETSGYRCIIDAKKSNLNIMSAVMIDAKMTCQGS